MKKYHEQILSQFNTEFSVNIHSDEAIDKCENDGLVIKTKIAEVEYPMGKTNWQFYRLTPKGLRYLANLLEKSILSLNR